MVHPKGGHIFPSRVFNVKRKTNPYSQVHLASHRFNHTTALHSVSLFSYFHAAAEPGLSETCRNWCHRTLKADSSPRSFPDDAKKNLLLLFLGRMLSWEVQETYLTSHRKSSN